MNKHLKKEKKMSKQPIIRERGNEETLYHMAQSLEVLDIGIEAYKEKKHSAWMIISGRLHELLTDTSPYGKGIPLAMRLMPALKLHPLKNDFSKS